jgi:ABC-type branched-subunit amino acid transport system ATPase component
VSGFVLRADSICKAFGGRDVLKSATLWAAAAQLTVLLGRNGCGKSTLLGVGAGVLAADAGVVLFAGRAYARPRLHTLARRGLFYLPERGLLTRNLTVGAHMDAVRRRFGSALASGHAALLRLDELLDRKPDTLSGGERRRAEVGLALARRPACLLADEPFMGVAPKDAELLSTAFRALAADGCAVVISGHEVPLLLELAHEVIWLASGTTHSLGSPAQARQHWQFRQEYLGGAPAAGAAGTERLRH